MQLTVPAAETHAHLFRQHTAQAALAERYAGGPLRDGGTIRRRRDQQLGKLLQARIAGDREAEVFDRCHSQLYARVFAAQGFAEVYSVDGGYEAWRAAV